MFQAKRTDPTDSDVSALNDSIRVLSEVVRHLSERIELLETRAAMTLHRPLDRSGI